LLIVVVESFGVVVRERCTVGVCKIGTTPFFQFGNRLGFCTRNGRWYIVWWEFVEAFEATVEELEAEWTWCA
jgi:hypothetical protein